MVKDSEAWPPVAKDQEEDWNKIEGIEKEAKVVINKGENQADSIKQMVNSTTAKARAQDLLRQKLDLMPYFFAEKLIDEIQSKGFSGDIAKTIGISARALTDAKREGEIRKTYFYALIGLLRETERKLPPTLPFSEEELEIIFAAIILVPLERERKERILKVISQVLRRGD